MCVDVRADLYTGVYVLVYVIQCADVKVLESESLSANLQRVIVRYSSC